MTIEVNLFWMLFLLVVAVFLFLLHNGFGLNLFIKKDEKIIEKDKVLMEKFLDKFPLVSPDFINKSAKEQNVENNQEIHELNKKIEEVESRINAQNININKVVIMLEELSKRG